MTCDGNRPCLNCLTQGLADECLSLHGSNVILEETARVVGTKSSPLMKGLGLGLGLIGLGFSLARGVRVTSIAGDAGGGAIGPVARETADARGHASGSGDGARRA